MSIVSNGSKITEKFLRENAEFIDILAISCDSFNPETNIKIGRGKTGQNVEQMLRISGWCREYGIKFKIKTVVCHLNWDEDMTLLIKQAQPFRWKAFQYVFSSNTLSVLLVLTVLSKTHTKFP
jgi:radical S-adenosyl methionine domain-containing protein 2